MARSPKVSVAPEVLIWARRSIGYDVPDAAKRLAIAPGRLVEFEEGADDPSVTQLRKMANVYGRPLAAFFLDAPPSDFDVMRDFRRVPGAERAWSPDLHKVFRRVEQQREVALDLLVDEGEEPEVSLPLIGPGTTAEDAAARVRVALGVTLREQASWRSPHESLNGWIAAAEALGILVMQASAVDIAEMRGFSISHAPLPLLVLNGTDSPRGRVFTLCHELGHLALRDAGLCDLHDAPDASDVEVWCNEFAACLLMPRDDFLAEPIVANGAGFEEWDDQELELLSARYGVSQEAVLRRLVTVRRASLAHYLERREEFREAYEAYQAEQMARAKREGRKIIPQVPTMTVRDLGKPYVRLVLDAYARRSISTSSLSDHLGVRLKHLPKIIERAR